MSDGPISSYSDPIYDRLDIFAQHLKRQWPVYITAIIVVAVTLVIIVRARQSRPDAVAAVAFSHALEESDPVKRAAALAEVAKDGSSPAYRAIALNQLVELKLEAKDVPGARATAQEAIAAADASEDPNLQLTAQLSLAAVQMQAGEFDKAEATFAKVRSKAGSTERLRAEALAALIGGAQAAAKQGPEGVAKAIDLLEPLLIRTVAKGSEDLHTAGTVYYWRLKRQQAEAAGSATAAPATTAVTPPAAPAAIAAPAASAPATPAAP
jgi:predicted negative regulator of RcsB-dependent stress response